MREPLDADAGSVPSIGRRQLVLVDGRTFAISDESGQMNAPTHGVVHDDLRHLSRFEVRVREAPLEVLASSAPTPLTAVVVGRVEPAAGGPRAHRHPTPVGGGGSARGRRRPQHLTGAAALDAQRRRRCRLRPRVRRQGRPCRTGAPARHRRRRLADRVHRRHRAHADQGHTAARPVPHRIGNAAVGPDARSARAVGGDGDGGTRRRRRRCRSGVPDRSQPGGGDPDAPSGVVAGVRAARGVERSPRGAGRRPGDGRPQRAADHRRGTSGTSPSSPPVRRGS